MKRQPIKPQKGAFLVMVSISLVLLIGIGALSIDLGRMFVLRSQMQNAADAAALAGAMELRASPGSIANAEIAAQAHLEHNSGFAGVQDLLANIEMEFFCVIGSEYDPTDPEEIADFCPNGTDNADGRRSTTDDQEARYIRVSMAPDSDSEAYSIGFYFLPVLAADSPDSEGRGYLSASAIAGRNFFMCNFPQMMLCNPFEHLGADFQEHAEIGQQFNMRQDDPPTRGNFGFLEADTDGGSGMGTPEVSEDLADSSITECSSPIFTTTAPGNRVNRTANAINTRFGIYENPGFGRGDAESRWPSAPIVQEYPRDQVFAADDSAPYGDNDWDRTAYFEEEHNLLVLPEENMTRREVYDWEHDNLSIPNPDLLERRTMHIAVINCEVRGISGTETFAMVPPEGFAEFFLTERAGGPPNPTIFAEYVSWTEATNKEDYHVDVQLYE